MSCLQVDFYHLAIITGGLGSHFDLPQFNSPSFFSVVIFTKLALGNWQMQTEFVSVFSCQNLISPSRILKFHVLYPNTKENKMQFNPGLKL
jgi:hypothetical protein